MKKYLLLLIFGFATMGVANADAVGVGDGITSGPETTESTAAEQSWWDIVVDWFIDDES